MDELGNLIEGIRRKVIAEAEQKFADETFLHLRCSLNNARMMEADVAVCVKGECGYSMEIYLKFRNEYVEEASYLTDADAQARFCGSCATELAIGKTCLQIMRLTVADVLKRVGRSGKDAEGYALFALSALQKAVRDYRSGKQDMTLNKTYTKNARFIAAGKNSPHLQYSN